jgi:hypothetical protein
MQQLAKYIVLIGVILVIAGFILYFFGNKMSWLGRLPGDIRIEKENFSFYFPITTMIIFSVIITILVKLFQFFNKW